jgi:hypothetical protein
MLASFDAHRVDVTLLTPPFRKSDLKVETDATTKLASAELPGIATAVMVKWSTPPVIEDGRVELASANMTLRMHPP